NRASRGRRLPWPRRDLYVGSSVLLAFMVSGGFGARASLPSEAQRASRSIKTVTRLPEGTRDGDRRRETRGHRLRRSTERARSARGRLRAPRSGGGMGGDPRPDTIHI